MIRFKGAFVKHEIFITPAIGIRNNRSYYGYPVFAVCFAWLHFRFKIEFGIKKVSY